MPAAGSWPVTRVGSAAERLVVEAGLLDWLYLVREVVRRLSGVVLAAGLLRLSGARAGSVQPRAAGLPTGCAGPPSARRGRDGRPCPGSDKDVQAAPELGHLAIPPGVRATHSRAGTPSRSRTGAPAQDARGRNSASGAS